MLLRDGPYLDLHTFCRSCHARATAGARDIHQEASFGKTACPRCHDRVPVPGTDTFKTVTFTVRLSILCLMCHDYDAHPSGADHCRVQPEKRTIVRPLTFDDLKRQVTCVSCHNPHILENVSAKLRNTIHGVEACWNCHEQ
jgi:hypothetical protein